MRLNIPLCLSFLGALVSFSSVSARATYSRQLQLAERDAELINMRDAGLLDLRDDDFLDLRDDDFLEIRDEDHLDMRDEGFLDIRDVEALYEMLVRRAPKKTAAQAATRKAAASAAANKNGKAPTARGAPRTATHAASQQAANAKTAARKAAGREKFGAAAAAHKKTTNLPKNHDVFKVPNSRGPAGKKKGPTFTGKEVKKAVFDSHMAHQTQKQLHQAKQAGTLSNTQYKKQLQASPLKNFGNSNHREPHAHHPNDVKSINKNMNGKGHEFPIGDPVNKGPARVITQKTKGGHTTFKGVVAHDIGRTSASPGYNDHFQVKPTRH